MDSPCKILQTYSLLRKHRIKHISNLNRTHLSPETIYAICDLKFWQNTKHIVFAHNAELPVFGTMRDILKQIHINLLWNIWKWNSEQSDLHLHYSCSLQKQKHQVKKPRGMIWQFIAVCGSQQRSIWKGPSELHKAFIYSSCFWLSPFWLGEQKAGAANDTQRKAKYSSPITEASPTDGLN